ncbi:MAG: hypothetical protein QOD39_5127 [Mycobacterium sp.]|nr:hypothetical protein [Mycobacterium sp.]
MDRDSMAEFLRARRMALTPKDVGLPAGSRRKVRGLRREEVAQMTHMSVDYYTRLEQRRAPPVGTDVGGPAAHYSSTRKNETACTASPAQIRLPTRPPPPTLSGPP